MSGPRTGNSERYEMNRILIVEDDPSTKEKLLKKINSILRKKGDAS